MIQVQMKMPDLATTGSDIRVIRWLVQPGQAILRGQPLLEIETDKGISQVEAIASGTLKEARVLPNSMVAVGQVIAVLEVTGHVQQTPMNVLTTNAELSPVPVPERPPHPAKSGGLFARNREAQLMRKASAGSD